MDHLTVLHEKIGRLRAEIAQLQELNAQYRRARSFFLKDALSWLRSIDRLKHGKLHFIDELASP